VRLHRAAIIQRPTGWPGQDALALEQPLASHSEIRAGLECGRFEGRNAICTLPMNICQLRSLNVPPGSDHERRTIIGDELAEEFSAAHQAMEFDFWEIDSGKVEKNTDAFNVNVLATTRLWVAQLWRDCRKTGLDCWALDGVPLAMARAVSLSHESRSNQRTLAIDWGFSNTTLCIVGDERPLYSRRIQDCAFGRVLDAIMNSFNITLDEAQHLAETQGLAGSGDDPCAEVAIQTAIADAAAEPLDELVRQIGRTLQFMDTQRRHLQPTSICLMGGGAFLNNIGSYLNRALSLPVQIWQMQTGVEPISCAAGHRAAVFGNAAALSALAWRTAA
jgi:Tfp pilus assembly PilM family ATPase